MEQLDRDPLRSPMESAHIPEKPKKNPFAKYGQCRSSKENRGSDNRGQQCTGRDPTIRRVIAPAKPAVVYEDDRKSATILSTLLMAKVPAKMDDMPQRRTKVVERKRASLVPLVGTGVIRENDCSNDIAVDGERPAMIVSKATRMDGAIEVLDKRSSDAMHHGVVEEINLISDDDEIPGCVGLDDGLEQRDTHLTGVALFDAFSAGGHISDNDDVEGYNEYHSDLDQNECGDESGMFDARRSVVDDQNVHAIMVSEAVKGPWWKRFTDFVPVSELSSGRDPRNGSTVFVHYMSQFKGTKIPQGSNINSNSNHSDSDIRKHRKKNSIGGGHWVSRDGERCYVTDRGENLSGRAAYIAYRQSKQSTGKKLSTAKRYKKKRKSKK